MLKKKKSLKRISINLTRHNVKDRQVEGRKMKRDTSRGHLKHDREENPI